MDEVTQQNAALVEEASAAAASLEEQAAQLETAVATFRLSGLKTPQPNSQRQPQPSSLRLSSPASSTPVRKEVHKSPSPEWEEF